MNIGLWIMVAALPVLLVICGAASALETALFSLTYHDRQRLAKSDPRLARIVERLLLRPREFLVSDLLITMVASTLYMVLTTLIAANTGRVWASAGLAVLNVLAMTLMAEVVSKLLAARYRVGVCRLLARPMLSVFFALGPVRVFLDRGIIAPLTRLLAPRREEQTSLSVEELAGLLELGAREGAIRDDEHRLLRAVIDFGALRVRDIMTPRVDVEWLGERDGVEAVREVVARTRLTRLPVCKGPGRTQGPGAGAARAGLDAGVLGLLNTKRYLAAAAEGAPPPLSHFLEPAVYVPQATALDKHLENARGAAMKVALCVDEHGGVTGVVSAQDMVQRLVAEVTAAPASGGQDAPQEGVRDLGGGRYSVAGRLSVREWAEMFGLEAQGRFSTVAGFVMARLGRVPRPGDEVRLGNLRLRVADVEGRVVERVEVTLDSADGAPARPPLAAPPSSRRDA